ncbi:MAG: hypothetical protein NZ951_02560 [Dehalococcoidia bacterium]|nr:hypothetical protein [Dehalococcoidia bacterium]MDW8119842.1 hypothetical protein [Chloroflexota bacterium]
MTIAIGLRCADGAVFACDSQETRGNFFRYWPQIHLVQGRFAIVSAGNPTLGEVFTRRLGEVLDEKGENTPLTPARALTLIEGVLRKMAEEGGESAVKERQILVAGFLDGGEKGLWAIDAEEMHPREMRTWECYGSGRDVGDMVLSDLYFPGIRVKEAVALVAYVVDAVSALCVDCGGPVQVATLTEQGLRLMDQDEVDRALKRVKGKIDRLRKELPKRVIRQAGG